MTFKRGLPFLVAAFVAPLLAAPLAALAQGSQPACPGDTVVWENTSTHVYHLSGDKYFGKTKHGAYACKADADKAGYHQAKAGGKMKGGAGASTSTGTSTSTSTSAGASASPGSMSSGGKHHRHHKGAMGAASPAPSPAST